MHLYWLTVEQQFNPALAITCPEQRERQPLAIDNVLEIY